MPSPALDIDSAHYRRHPLHPQLLLISAHEYASLVSRALGPSSVPPKVFPYLHGADRSMNSHTTYFTGRCEPCSPPNFAGLVTLATPSCSSSPSLSSPPVPSPASSSDDSDTESALFSNPLPTGPEPRPALLSSLDPQDIFGPDNQPDFLRPPLPPTVCLRNYSIQPSQYASIAHIVVYDPAGPTDAALNLALRAEFAHRRLRSRRLASRQLALTYHTFLLTDPITVFESSASLRSLVAVDSSSFSRNRIDFPTREREEMLALTHATPISSRLGIWVGNSADVPSSSSASSSSSHPPHRGVDSCNSCDSLSVAGDDEANPLAFSICIEALDFSSWPPAQLSEQFVEADSQLCRLASDPTKVFASSSLSSPSEPPSTTSSKVLRPGPDEIVRLTVPSSINCLAPTYLLSDASLALVAESLISYADWVIAQSDPLNPNFQRRVLLYSNDGYTDSSLFALILIMTAQRCSLHEAYLHMHIGHNRGFFVHREDLQLLELVESRLFQQRNLIPVPPRPLWFLDPAFDGTLPSRILDNVYLGSLGHAFNADLLTSLGITHVLSAGESALSRAPPPPPVISSNNRFSYFHVAKGHFFKRSSSTNNSKNTEEETEQDIQAKVIRLNSLADYQRKGQVKVFECGKLSDDGIDRIQPFMEPALEFITQAHREGGKVLIHCRMGVSRSATLVIAYCMRSLSISLISSYLLVRARRLNILIQPTLPFMWALHEFESEEVVRRQKLLDEKRIKESDKNKLIEVDHLSTPVVEMKISEKINATTSSSSSITATITTKSNSNNILSKLDQEQELIDSLAHSRISWPLLARETYRLNAKYLG